MLKNHFSLLIGCLLLVSACRSSAKKNNNTISTSQPNSADNIKNTKSKLDYNNPLLKDYISFLLGLDTNQIESSTKAATQFAALFKDKSQDICDSAYLIFNNFYGKLNNSIDNLHFKTQL